MTRAAKALEQYNSRKIEPTFEEIEQETHAEADRLHDEMADMFQELIEM